MIHVDELILSNETTLHTLVTVASHVGTSLKNNTIER